MFEVVLEIVVTVAVLALCGTRKAPVKVSEVSEILEVKRTVAIDVADKIIAACDVALANDDALEAEMLGNDAETEVLETLEVAAVIVDEQIAHQAAPDYAAMSLERLKAEGKRLKVRGWQAWKKPATAIARLTAAAA